ncbi:MAG: nitroreductase [Chloroflexi bacterium]|nr:nitroreductase [Chloroflexota bacterium]
METLEAIATRRSIRRFRRDPIAPEVIEKILTAASMAPSGKNRQPWRFVIVREDQRDAMIEQMRAGIASFKARGESVGSAEGTAAAMEQAPVTVFIFNTDGKRPWLDHSIGELFWETVCVQSVGAAIQNICLAAHALGLGSLWICDVFYAYEELAAWLGQDTQMVAAVSLGYPADNPVIFSRKPLADVTVWF